MKYLITLLLLIITSCTVNEVETVPTTSRGKFAIEDFAYDVTAAEFTYKGHSYIWFHSRGGWDGHDGVVHNPDCKCNKK